MAWDLFGTGKTSSSRGSGFSDTGPPVDNGCVHSDRILPTVADDEFRHHADGDRRGASHAAQYLPDQPGFGGPRRLADAAHLTYNFTISQRIPAIRNLKSLTSVTKRAI